MNSFYKSQTKIMISNLKTTGTLNVVRDFYAQLSNIRPINSLSIINALNAGDMDSSKLIHSSITYREWMSHISLEDIRNHIVFTIWKENRTVVSEYPYYDTSINNELYHQCHRPSDAASMHAEDIGNLLETCFYIRQVCAIKELIEDNFDDLSILDDPDWEMYHVWVLNSVNTNGLVKTVFENFKLLDSIIKLRR